MKSKKSIVYVPPGAKFNIKQGKMDAPETEYEDRKRIIDIEVVKKVAKGKYGKNKKT